MGATKPKESDSSLKKANAELKAKLEEAAEYAKSADEKIAALETENAELKAAVKKS